MGGLGERRAAARRQFDHKVNSQSGEDRALEKRVEALAREIAEEINASGGEAREVLREVAVSTLRDAVEEVPPAPAQTPAAGTFNSFGIGIPLFLMGAVLIFLFPPMGLLMFATAILAIAWGIIGTLFARSR